MWGCHVILLMSMAAMNWSVKKVLLAVFVWYTYPVHPENSDENFRLILLDVHMYIVSNGIKHSWFR